MKTLDENYYIDLLVISDMFRSLDHFQRPKTKLKMLRLNIVLEWLPTKRILILLLIYNKGISEKGMCVRNSFISVNGFLTSKISRILY